MKPGYKIAAILCALTLYLFIIDGINPSSYTDKSNDEVIRYLVEEPDEVRVNMTEGQNTIVFEIKVAASDLGFVIGKQGQNINAIQTLLNALGGRR